jgi:hypothetical protein
MCAYKLQPKVRSMMQFAELVHPDLALMVGLR